MSEIDDSVFSTVHLTSEEATGSQALSENRPFRILLAGNFSGGPSRSQSPGAFIPLRVDRDNVDDAVHQLRVALDLDGLSLSFDEIEDFHPDRIYARVTAFQNLDRQDLDRRSSASPAPEIPGRGGSLLDQIVDEQAPPTSAPVSVDDANDMSSFIRRITAGHLVSSDPAATNREARHHALSNKLMRAILHDPRFQSIEAAWRAVLLLVRDLDEGNDLQLHLLDVSLPELISQTDAIRNSLKRKGPWALIVCNYEFGQAEIDIQVLQRIGEMGQLLNAPVLAGAKLPGDEDPHPVWVKFRESAAAKWIGLALPRFLLRLPYGKATSEIESFPFEEMPQSEHSAYLWGNPAFLCADLLGKSFLSNGWDPSPLHRRMENMPMHVYQEDGDAVAKPCAEVLMTEREAFGLMDLGFIPVASLKHQNAAMVVRFQSIALPLASLPGF